MPHTTDASLLAGHALFGGDVASLLVLHLPPSSLVSWERVCHAALDASRASCAWARLYRAAHAGRGILHLGALPRAVAGPSALVIARQVACWPREIDARSLHSSSARHRCVHLRDAETEAHGQLCTVAFEGTAIGGDRCVRADQPFPPLGSAPFGLLATDGAAPWGPAGAARPTDSASLQPLLSCLAYYEVTIGQGRKPPAAARPVFYDEDGTQPDSCIAVGLCTGEFSLVGRQPGWDRRSFGYHGDDGAIFHGSGESSQRWGPSFGEGDTIGCGIAYGPALKCKSHYRDPTAGGADAAENTYTCVQQFGVFFTLNGEIVQGPDVDDEHRPARERMHLPVGPWRRNFAFVATSGGSTCDVGGFDDGDMSGTTFGRSGAAEDADDGIYDSEDDDAGVVDLDDLAEEDGDGEPVLPPQLMQDIEHAFVRIVQAAQHSAGAGAGAGTGASDGDDELTDIGNGTMVPAALLGEIQDDLGGAITASACAAAVAVLQGEAGVADGGSGDEEEELEESEEENGEGEGSEGEGSEGAGAAT
eukprot:g1195.t1